MELLQPLIVLIGTATGFSVADLLGLINSTKFAFDEVCVPCCESGPTPLCCQHGVCSNENFVYNTIMDNADECQCLCTDNFTGLFKYI